MWTLITTSHSFQVPAPGSPSGSSSSCRFLLFCDSPVSVVWFPNKVVIVHYTQHCSPPPCFLIMTKCVITSSCSVCVSRIHSWADLPQIVILLVCYMFCVMLGLADWRKGVSYLLDPHTESPSNLGMRSHRQLFFCYSSLTPCEMSNILAQECSQAATPLTIAGSVLTHDDETPVMGLALKVSVTHYQNSPHLNTSFKTRQDTNCSVAAQIHFFNE